MVVAAMVSVTVTVAEAAQEISAESPLEPTALLPEEAELPLEEEELSLEDELSLEELSPEDEELSLEPLVTESVEVAALTPVAVTTSEMVRVLVEVLVN